MVRELTGLRAFSVGGAGWRSSNLPRPRILDAGFAVSCYERTGRPRSARI
jgi:hypothetical protein